MEFFEFSNRILLSGQSKFLRARVLLVLDTGCVYLGSKQTEDLVPDHCWVEDGLQSVWDVVGGQEGSGVQVRAGQHGEVAVDGWGSGLAGQAVVVQEASGGVRGQGKRELLRTPRLGKGDVG